jgi:hypothetical protein
MTREISCEALVDTGQWKLQSFLLSVLIWAFPCGDFDENNHFLQEKHEMILCPNYFTGLTLLCGALSIGVTLVYVASMRTAPYIQADVAQPT